MSQPNPSTAQARAMVDEMSRHGVTMAAISPGSRSAALAIAFDEHPGIDTRVVLDERSAAYFALGHARATGTPTVAVSTSGTAVANYLPAVVEADLAMVALILITADRPPELRHVGANQTIDQVRIFGDRTRWFCDVGLAEPGIDLNGYWRSTVAQAVSRARGHGARPGPVHLNLSFREPTVPVADDGRSHSPGYPFSIEGRPGGAPWQFDAIAEPGAAVLEVLQAGRGLVIAGEGTYDRRSLIQEADRLGWPVLATALSRARGEGTVTHYHHLLVDGVPAPLMPDVVVTVGHIGPSSRVSSLLGAGCPQVHIDRWGAWRDPTRLSTHVVEADPAATLAGVLGVADPEWRTTWAGAADTLRGALVGRLADDAALTGPGVALALGSTSASTLVVSSSMPVRDVDAFFDKAVDVFANRGASGIDGFVSTALGIASSRPGAVALSGDLSFLHDAGGLVVDRLPDVCFVIVDNRGGGLFDLLPQARHAPGFERLFVAPHGLDLVSVGASHGLVATEVSSAEDLGAAVDSALSTGGARVVVVPVDRETDLKMRRVLDDVARGVVRSL